MFDGIPAALGRAATADAALFKRRFFWLLTDVVPGSELLSV
jgi:hypothetical protein